MDPQQFWNTGTAAPSNPAQDPAPDPGGEQPGFAAAPDAQGAPAQSEQQPGESTVDYEARTRELEASLAAREADVNRLSGTMQQVQQWAEQTSAQQQEQQFQQGLQQYEQDIYRRAETMNPQDAYQYIQNENAKIRQALIDRTRQVQQQAQQQVYQVQRTAATPLYLEELARANGLTDAAKQELLAVGDPDLAARQAPLIKQRYEQIDNLQNQLNQLSRSRQAGQLQAAGVGMVGGTGVQNVPTELAGDSDTRSMQILAQLRNGTYTPAQ